MVQTSREVLVEKVVKAQRQENKGVRPKDVEKRGDMWRKGRRLYVPASIREDVMKEHHDSTLAGHPGATKTIQLIACRYWWPRMSADVRVDEAISLLRQYENAPLRLHGVETASSNLSAEEFAKHVKEVHELAQGNLTQANEDMKRFYDRHAGKSITYEAGQKVFLDGRNIKTIRPMKKMDDKWFGPFEKKVHPVFNEILLKPAIQPSFESQKKPPSPPPVIIDEQEEYEVEEILDSRLHRGKLQFLVKWVGYEEATWQPESDVKDNAQESIQEFYR
ncbi:hypothetical protein ACEPAF_2684 [Sanghuangporus sanghuang]